MASRDHTLWPQIRQELENRVGHLPRENAAGWIGPISSPFREDKSPSFSVNVSGGFRDHATGEKGGGYELARLLGIEYRTKASANEEFTSWCQRRVLSRAILETTWGATPGMRGSRPAIVFPTPLGVDRIRYLDDQRPKSKWKTKGKAHWYGLEQAKKLDSGPIYIVNGEPSVWACHQSGVAAVCTCTGEKGLPAREEFDALVAIGRPIRVVLDLDEPGRDGAARMLRVLRTAGATNADALELPADLGAGGDVDDLHRKTLDSGLAKALEALPSLTVEEHGNGNGKDHADFSTDPDQFRSDWAIGETILTKLRPPEADLVTDHDRVYRYDGKAGFWRYVSEERLARHIGELDGQVYDYGRDGDAKRLRISARTVRSIIDCMKWQSGKEGFFEEAETGGVQCSDGYVRVTDDLPEIGPSSPDHRQTFGFTEPWSAGERRADRWLTTLDEWFEGETDAPDKRLLLQEFVGACLFGLAPEFGKVLLLTGGGANGKSVFIDVVTGLFPPDAVCAVAPHLMGHEYYVIQMLDRRLNVCADIPPAEILSSEAFKKSVTGDLVTGRNIRQAPVSFRPRCGHVFSCNELPGTVDQTSGFWRRFLVVSFEKQFSGARARKGLAEWILEADRMAIVSWAAYGACRLLNRGQYTIPASSREMLDRWRTQADQVAMFVEEAAETTENDADWTKASDLYRAYRNWAQRNGHRALSSNSFGRRMGLLQYDRHRRNNGVHYALKVTDHELLYDEQMFGGRRRFA